MTTICPSRQPPSKSASRKECITAGSVKVPFELMKLTLGARGFSCAVRLDETWLTSERILYNIVLTVMKYYLLFTFQSRIPADCYEN